MDERLISAVEKFGLSEKEAKVYLACLELGSAPAYSISLKAYIPRTLTYDILDRLIELGLVSSVYIGKKKHFKVANPSKMLLLLKEKKTALQSVMGMLTMLYNNTDEKERPQAFLFQGKEGIKTIYEDLLFSGVKEYIALGSSGKAIQILPYYMAGFFKKKAEMKIKLKLIFSDTPSGRKRGRQLEEYGYNELRYIPPKYAAPISIWVYGHCVAIMLWSEHEPIAIKIDGKHITDGFRNYLNALWDSAKRK